MKKTTPFQIRRVKRYRSARYASESPENMIGYAAWLSWAFPKKLVKGAVTLLLLAGLSLGAVGCVDDDITFENDKQEQTDGDAAKTSDGDAEESIDGDSLIDGDGLIDGDLITDGDYDYLDGGDVYPTDGDIVTDGDDPTDGDDVVDGDYDLIAGEMVECEPGDMACNDDGNLAICTDDYYFEHVNCAEECTESFGVDYFTYGCDAENEVNPCLCEYGQIDGGMVECSPEEVYCDDNSLVTCPDYYPIYTECDTYCSETYGPDYYSLGCDAEAEDPCQCEYGMIDGDWVECLPEDVSCDGNSMVTCDDYYPVYTDCDTYCSETYGPDYFSMGCDAEQEEPCQCEYGIIDGDFEEVNPEDVE